MKNLFTLILLSIFVSACSTTIPMQSSLSDQTMLMADNKNIEANYSLTSNVPNGKITEVYVQKNGNERSSQRLDYASETAFNNIWSSYFSNKFNDFSDETMNVNISLNELYLKETSATSMGVTFLTGNAKSNVEAITEVYVEVDYNGEKYQNEFQVSSSDYQETQSTQYGTFSNTNPMQQKSQLLESSLNKAVIQFDNFVNSILSSHNQ